MKAPMNTDKPKTETILVDIDGCLVKHNYNPAEIPDVLIESTYNWLRAKKDKGAIIVATTARSKDQVGNLIGWLPELAEVIDDVLCNLGTGRRYLINDKKPGMPSKAIALNLIRDQGFNG